LCCDQTIKEAEGDIYKELFRRVRLWAANPKKNGHDKAFDVWSSERERVHSEQLRIESVCKSCPKGLCSFFARTTFSSETSQFHIQYCGKHHDGPQKMPGRRIMNADQECKYYASDASPGVARLTAFVDLPYAPPSPRQLQRRAKRDKHKAMPADEQPCGLWPTESVKHAFREAGVRAPTDDDFTGDDELEMYMLGTETFQDTGGNDHVAFVVSSLPCLLEVCVQACKQTVHQIVRRWDFQTTVRQLVHDPARFPHEAQRENNTTRPHIDCAILADHIHTSRVGRRVWRNWGRLLRRSQGAKPARWQALDRRRTRHRHAPECETISCRYDKDSRSGTRGVV
jgi:hypothetical protein